MATSGHRSQFIKESIISGLVSYEKMVGKSILPSSDPGHIPLHKPRTFRQLQRQRKKAKNKQDWFTDKKKAEPSPAFWKILTQQEDKTKTERHG